MITYAVQAVLPTSAMGPATQAAARIDALLEDQPLTIPGYGWLSTVRVERLTARRANPTRATRISDGSMPAGAIGCR